MSSEEKQKANTRDENGKFLPGYTPPTAWKPGQSGNPKGRPENEDSITYWLKHELAQPNGGGRPTAHSIAKGIIAEAKKRKPWACELILDRTEGKAKQSVEVTGKDGKDLMPDPNLSQYTTEELLQLKAIHDRAKSRGD